MSDDGYQEVRRITMVKREPQQGKIKRWVMNPMVNIGKKVIETDSKKKRVSA